MTGPKRTITKAVRLPSSVKQYLSMDSEWFAEYLSRGLGEVNDCNVENQKKKECIVNN